MNTDEMTPMQRNALHRATQTKQAQKNILFALRYGQASPNDFLAPETVKRAVRHIHDYYYLSAEER